VKFFCDNLTLGGGVGGSGSGAGESGSLVGSGDIGIQPAKERLEATGESRYRS
jgi:hypothetical protein